MVDALPDQIKTLDESQIRVDGFDQDLAVGDRNVAFSAELLRLALLAIGGVGYLLKTPTARAPISADPGLLIATAILMALCGASALAHRYIASDMLASQLKFARLRDHRLESDQAQAEKEWAREWRLKSAGPLLAICALFFLAGTLVFIAAISGVFL